MVNYLGGCSAELQENETRSVAIHQRIEFIHPFPDANGRVARLAMNHILRRYQKGYVILPPINESNAHFDALEQAHEGNGDALFLGMQELLQPSLISVAIRGARQNGYEIAPRRKRRKTRPLESNNKAITPPPMIRGHTEGSFLGSSTSCSVGIATDESSVVLLE